MISTASQRAAFIVAAGLLVLLANPVTAATDADDSSAPDSKPAAVTHRTFRHAWHHRRHYVHRRSHPIATKADDQEADKKAPDATPATADSKTSSNIPPSIANANAQMLLAGVQLTAATVIPSGTDAAVTASDNPANATASGGTFMVAADQLNDVDKMLQEGSSSTAATAAASPSAAPATTPPATAAVAMTSESSTWDQTSLIGKIFIGFGALLTMASAARMFIG
jgi:hypothetical protein